MRTKGGSIDNPAYLAGANVISAIANVPLDRAVKKITNIVDASNEETRILQKNSFSAWLVSLGVGRNKKEKTETKKK